MCISCEGSKGATGLVGLHAVQRPLSTWITCMPYLDGPSTSVDEAKLSYHTCLVGVTNVANLL